MEEATEQTTPSTWRKLRVIVYLAMVVAVLIIGTKVYDWYEHRQEVLAAETWLMKCDAIQDSWQRYQALAARPPLTAEQYQRAINRQDAALVSALQSGNKTALRSVEEHSRTRFGGGSVPLVDKYPANPEQRARHIATLTTLWPNINAMSVSDRVSLFHMSKRCHLHELQQPKSEDILSCLRFGAKSLGTEKELTRLLDVAQLGAPLTEL